MKKFLKAFVLVIFAVCTLCALASCQDEAPKLKYRLNEDGDGYVVTGFSGDSYKVQELVVPAVHNGKPVTQIGDHAFKYCNLTSVTLPDRVTKIDSSAFRNNSYLESVNFPAGLISIEDSAFAYCYSLTNVILPDSLTKIGDSAFSYCANKLTKITIPASVSEIGDTAFENCRNLEKVVWNAENYQSENTGSEIFKSCYQLTHFVIGEGVTAVPEKVLQSCRQLTNVTLPKSIDRIEEGAFAYCGRLTGVAYGGKTEEWNALLKDELWDDGMPSYTVYCINGDKFIEKERIETQGLSYYLNADGESYTVIGLDRAKDKNIVIPALYGEKPVTAIGDSAFEGCNGITGVTIPNSVVRVGNSAFKNCKSLIRVTIGKNVASFGKDAFSGAVNLTDVFISDLAAWCKITCENNWASPLLHAEYLYLNGTLITELVIPEGVTSIGKYAFEHCQSITKVTIPSSVTEIGYGAFYDCNGLTGVYITDLSAWCKISYDGGVLNNPLCYAHNLYLNGTLVTELIIPEDITEIKYSAFYYCKSITSVTLPSGIERIGFEAFVGCNNVNDITFRGTKEEWNSLQKDSLWNGEIGKYTVHYDDGDIAEYGDFTGVADDGSLLI